MNCGLLARSQQRISFLFRSPRPSSPLIRSAVTIRLVATAMPSILVSNGKPQPCVDFSPTTFLLSMPQAIYVTARTIKKTRVVEFDRQIERLVISANARLQAADVGVAVGSFTTVQMRKPVVLACREALEQFRAENPDEAADGERRLRVMLDLGSPNPDLPLRYSAHIFVEALPPIRKPPIKIMVVSLPPDVLHKPGVKDSEWVKERQTLEEVQRAGGFEEIVFTDGNGDVCEGLQSNFFIIRNDKVLTSEDDRCLPGTVRAMVLDEAGKMDLPLSKEIVPISTVRDWQGAFVTSTSRLVLPVDEMVVRADAFQAKGAEDVHIRFGEPLQHEHLTRIKEAVQTQLMEHSFDVAN